LILNILLKKELLTLLTFDLFYFRFLLFEKTESNAPVIENDPVVRRRRIELVSRFANRREQNEVNLLDSEVAPRTTEDQA
jgi:hypothetical protein